SVFVPVCSAVGAVEAGDAIAGAERDLGSAYVAVSEAEGAGGDVSLLVARLNGAGELLGSAYAAFRAGDYDVAVSFAVECSRALEGVVADAALLKAEAKEAQSDMFLRTACLSGAGLGLFLVLVFVGWQLLKRRYFRRVLGMKPEVGEGP
ncbi:MAG: hypothetical protein ACUVUE_08095, partial [Candidatus Bathycorpusculaceae bacterium]